MTKKQKQIKKRLIDRKNEFYEYHIFNYPDKRIERFKEIYNEFIVLTTYDVIDGDKEINMFLDEITHLAFDISNEKINLIENFIATNLRNRFVGEKELENPFDKEMMDKYQFYKETIN